TKRRRAGTDAPYPARSVAVLLIFRKEVFQVRLGQIPGEPFLAEHIDDGLGFALLQLPDFFFDRSRGDQTIGVHRSRLADAMRAVDGLGFYRWVPPRIV